jgi:hypothetical protein
MQLKGLDADGSIHPAEFYWNRVYGELLVAHNSWGLAVLARMVRCAISSSFSFLDRYARRLLGPVDIRSVVAESVLIKQQLLILNRARQRSPNLFCRSPCCRFVY